MIDWKEPEGFVPLVELGPVEKRADTNKGPIYGRIVGVAPRFIFERERMWPVYRTCDKNGDFI